MIEERIDTLIEMYQSQLNGANERLKEDIIALIKAEQDELNYYAEKKDYLSSLTKEINDTEQKVNMIKEFLDLLKWIKKECTTSKWIPFTFDEEGVLNCELPDIGERILVSDAECMLDDESIWIDLWDSPDCGIYELESGEDLEGLVWMPLPNSYKGNQNENNR